uniref:Septin-type G domain-containing protein n=1 Tax=Labrus bergylta TaxID=56723 RepID=A0A3Q3G4M2_9LABR
INISCKYDCITCKDLIQSGPPAVYQLIPKKDNIGTIRRITLGKKNPTKTNRTVLLVGETGTGKSTMIDALINYDMGVKWEDNVWFEIIEKDRKRRKSEDKTLPYSLTIIDTPGYGDIRGTEHDDIISHRLFDLFRSDDRVHEMNVMGLVLKASENCPSDRQRYIFDSVASPIGKDMKNIVILITHSDGRIPRNVIQAVEVANIKCAKDEKYHPVHFLFQNCQNI